MIFRNLNYAWYNYHQKFLLVNHMFADFMCSRTYLHNPDVKQNMLTCGIQ